MTSQEAGQGAGSGRMVRPLKSPYLKMQPYGETGSFQRQSCKNEATRLGSDYIRKGDIWTDRHTHRGTMMCKPTGTGRPCDSRDAASYQPRTTKSGRQTLQLDEAGRVRARSWEGERGPAHTLTLGLQPPEPRGGEFMLLLATCWLHILYGSPWSRDASGWVLSAV